MGLEQVPIHYHIYICVFLVKDVTIYLYIIYHIHNMYISKHSLYIAYTLSPSVFKSVLIKTLEVASLARAGARSSQSRAIAGEMGRHSLQSPPIVIYGVE